jgi:hypothetical protein
VLASSRARRREGSCGGSRRSRPALLDRRKPFEVDRVSDDDRQRAQRVLKMIKQGGQV